MDELKTVTKLDSPLYRRENSNKRKLSLTKDERRQIKRHQNIIKAVELFLDVNNTHSWQEIADTLGIALRTLKTLVKSEDFVEAYNEYFDELTSDPRRRASIISLNNLLTDAIAGLGEMVRNTDLPPSVRFSAIKEVIRLNKVEEQVKPGNDRNEVANFLKSAGVNLNVNIGIVNNEQREFQKKIEENGYEHALNGSFVEEVNDE